MTNPERGWLNRVLDQATQERENWPEYLKESRQSDGRIQACQSGVNQQVNAVPPPNDNDSDS